MTTSQCASVRDLLPEHARHTLDEAADAGIAAHLEACAECATEYALVALLARHRTPPPRGLEARIIGAVRAPQPRPLWTPGRVALAAGVAGALLTGSLLVRQAGMGAGAAPPQVSLVEQAVQHGALTWLEEPLLSGGPALHELSVDELEALLLELES